STAVGTVDNVGSGEVFITAGQSNAGFWGQPVQRSATGKVSYYDGSAWLPCSDPVDLGDGGTGGAPWCLFGDMLVSKADVPVGIVPVAYGGTPISAWLPNARSKNGIRLYGRLAMRLQTLGLHGVRGILWHQGESDVGPSAALEDDYQTALQT